MQTYKQCSHRRKLTTVIISLMTTATLSWSCGAAKEQSSSGSSPRAATDSALAAPKRTDQRPMEQNVICEDERARVQTAMREIFLDFQRSADPSPVEVIVDIDGRIRALLESRPRYRPCPDDSDIYDSQWARMGVELGYWVDLSYSGALLFEAHRRDPHTALRKYTLFSTVFGTTPHHGLGVMPNIEAAFKYESEFPDGPYISRTLMTIANFHKDLFMVFRDDHRDYKYDCFKPYIDGDPIADQRARAKRIALEYYGKVLDLDPSNENARTLLNEVERETVKAW